MDKTVFDDIVKAVHCERVRQEEKWGVQQHHQDTWLTIIAEELGEVAEASLNYRRDEHKSIIDSEIASEALLMEYVQLAAVAFAAIEDIQFRFRGAENAFTDIVNQCNE